MHGLIATVRIFRASLGIGRVQHIFEGEHLIGTDQVRLLDRKALLHLSLCKQTSAAAHDTG